MPDASIVEQRPVEPGESWQARMAARLRVLPRLCLIVPFFGGAWCIAAAVCLVRCGAIAGWRDMKVLTGEGDQ